MSSDNSKSSGAPYPALLIGGLILMVGGEAIHKYVHIAVLESLDKQGLPIDLGETVATIGVLLILFPLVNTFFIKPLQEAIQERNSNLEKTFQEVEQLRDEMSKMKSDYDSRLIAAEANAREQIQNQIREAQVLRQTLATEATQKADLLLEQARVQIEQEKQSAIIELRGMVVDLTLGATEKLIGENMDDTRNRRLIEDFMSKEVAV
jgi:F-type H+-transporting ATPase subunit b